MVHVAKCLHCALLVHKNIGWLKNRNSAILTILSLSIFQSPPIAKRVLDDTTRSRRLKSRSEIPGAPKTLSSRFFG
uniref:Uncharacterized protein n=1 Tax=Acrobeloides nanus TaxID=290746 RepID=A0A914DHV5_9BILA